jgi:phosphoribosyl 1,2-cyclic phosphodiesterase
MYGAAYARYGGHTSCYSIETADGLLIVDAGTGILQLGAVLAQRAALPPITVLLTHVHLDHLTGLSMFRPILQSGVSITVLAPPSILPGWQQAVTTLIAPPYWPVALQHLGATVVLRDLPVAGSTIYGVKVSGLAIQHPQGGVSYRLEIGSRTLVIGTDREHGDAVADSAFLAFCRGVEVLVHDAQYTPAQLDTKRGWGHSSWEQAVDVAQAVGARRLILTSHDPNHTDEDIDALVQQAQQRFPNTQGAAEGLLVL